MASHFIEREKCPTCGSKNLTCLGAVSYNYPPLYKAIEAHYTARGSFDGSLLQDAEYNMQECNDCSLVFQKFVPNDYLMGQLYGVWHDLKITTFSKSQISRRNVGQFFEELKYLIRYFKTNEFKSFDFGMGRAHWASVALACGVDSYGSEVAEQLIEDAEKKGIKTIPYEKFHEYKEYFDFIHTEQVFEHLADPEKELLHLMQMLKPGGLIKLSVPPGSYAKPAVKEAFSKQKFDIDGKLKVCTPLQHLNAYTNKALVKFAEKNGFKYEQPNFFDWVKSREIVYPDSVFKTYMRIFYVHFIFKHGSSLYFKKVS